MKLKILKPVLGLLCIFHLSGGLMASEKSGVYCKSGTTYKYSNKVLKCYKTTTKTYTLGSMCPPLRFPQNITMDSRGRDSCLPVAIGRRVSSAKTPPLFGYPPISQFRRQVSRNGVDKFIARRSSRRYQHPRGKTYLHNAKKGVTCPSGYKSKYRSGRLKCYKEIRSRATCDGLFKIEQRRGKDLCVIKTLFGKTVGNYTIPAGYHGATGNPSRKGWKLHIKSGRDIWVKTKYKYPKGK